MNTRLPSSEVGWVLTSHADERRIEMRLTSTEVFATLEYSDLVRPHLADRHAYSGLYEAYGGDLLVIFNDTTGEVVTVLWRYDFAGNPRHLRPPRPHESEVP